MSRRSDHRLIVAIALAIAAALVMALASIAQADAREHSKFQSPEKAIAAAPGAKNPNCDRRADVVTRLAGAKYNEAQIGMGLHAQAKAVVELWVSADGGWSILLAMPNGKACMVASGSGWQTSILPLHGGEGG